MSLRIACLLAAAMLLFPVSPGVYADPPSHAPAHGWRKKHDPYYMGYTGRKWDNDYGIIQGTCNRKAIGTVLGGAVGGAIGSTVGKGDGKTVAIILGTVLGAVVGNRIGKSIDDADRGCIGHALELAPDRKTVAWSDPDGLNYKVTPLRGFTANGHPCREYRLAIAGRDVNESHLERACQVDEGRWEAYERH